jgi:O-antigen/teichoic acid export membrane protein
LSYVVHPYRPRISFSKASEIWAFSIWTFIRSIGSYFQRQVDVIAVGGALGTTSMGRYTVAKDIASSPTDEIVAPISAVLFPVMARYQHDHKQLRQLYLRLLGWVLIIGSSTGIGLWLIAPDLVPLVLGQKWVAVTPLVGWLAVTASIDALNSGAYATLDVLGFPHLGARLQWLRVLAMAVIILPVAYWTRDLGNIVVARFVVTLIVVPTLLLVVGRCIGITPRDYGAALWRPFVAGSVMVLVVCATNGFVPFTGPARLGIDVSLGAASYVGTLLALWHVCGRPRSAERDVIAVLERGQLLLGTIRARVLKTVQ